MNTTLEQIRKNDIERQKAKEPTPFQIIYGKIYTNTNKKNENKLNY